MKRPYQKADLFRKRNQISTKQAAGAAKFLNHVAELKKAANKALAELLPKPNHEVIVKPTEGKGFNVRITRIFPEPNFPSGGTESQKVLRIWSRDEFIGRIMAAKTEQDKKNLIDYFYENRKHYTWDEEGDICDAFKEKGIG